MKSRQKSKRIPLTQGKFAIVDAEDYERLNRHKWHALKDRHMYRAVRHVRQNGKAVKIYMHREIMQTPEGVEIKHINHNGLDNRKNNLRFCTRAQSEFGQRPCKNKTSRFKGVCWDKILRKWASQIRWNYKAYWLGRFDDEIAAAKAYDCKAIELFGEFARLNFPKDQVA